MDRLHVVGRPVEGVSRALVPEPLFRSGSERAGDLSHVVTADHGPRPAGPPDRCFYCDQPVGREHRRDCVLRLRPVTVEIRMLATFLEPEAWEAKDIEARLRWGTWCADNLVDLLAERDEEHGCLCRHVDVRYAGEVDAVDWDTVEPVPGLVLPRCQWRQLGRRCSLPDRHLVKHRLARS